ncbi:MAG TPA: flavin reductase [Burkholderiaceae bacterium]|nr:flavin reductase [Burkholderiaceae bacterium]
MTADRAFDPKEFRKTLGTFTTGVTIITTRAADGTPVGITANSFNSVSLDPPMVLWSLARNARSLAAFDKAQHWAVHILSADQEPLSNRFARSSEDKFSGVPVDTGIGDVPLLSNCTSRLQCRTSFKYEGGDHIIFVGEVLAFDRNDVAPLVFHGGAYAVAARKTDSSLAGSAPVRDVETSFGEDFMAYLLTRAHFQVYAPLRKLLRSHALSDAEWFVLSSLTAKNGRSFAELNAMYAITGDELPGPVLEVLEKRELLCRSSDAADAAVQLTDAGRDMALRVLAAAKAIEADLTPRLGIHESGALKNLLRQVIQLTDPGLPDMWGRAPG